MAGNVPKDEDPEGLSHNQTSSSKTTTHLRVISDAAFKKEPKMATAFEEPSSSDALVARTNIWSVLTLPVIA